MNSCSPNLLLVQSHQAEIIRGGVEDTRFEAGDPKKSEAKAKDNSTEDRLSRGQGQKYLKPRTKGHKEEVISKKTFFFGKFRRSPKKSRSSLNNLVNFPEI